jgi:hypothetical protein
VVSRLSADAYVNCCPLSYGCFFHNTTAFHEAALGDLSTVLCGQLSGAPGPGLGIRLTHPQIAACQLLLGLYDNTPRFSLADGKSPFAPTFDAPQAPNQWRSLIALQRRAALLSQFPAAFDFFSFAAATVWGLVAFSCSVAVGVLAGTELIASFYSCTVVSHLKFQVRKYICLFSQVLFLRHFGGYTNVPAIVIFGLGLCILVVAGTCGHVVSSGSL